MHARKKTKEEEEPNARLKQREKSVPKENHARKQTAATQKRPWPMNPVRKGWDGQFGLEAREALQSSSSGRESSSATVQTPCGESDMHRLSKQGVPGRLIMTTSGNKSFESTKIDSRRTPSTIVSGCLAGRRPLCGRQKETCHRLARQNGEAAKTSRIDSLSLRFLVYTRWSLQHSNQSMMCKLKGHVGTAIQALGFGLDRAASTPRRCAPRSGFARSSPHPWAGLFMYFLFASASRARILVSSVGSAFTALNYHGVLSIMNGLLVSGKSCNWLPTNCTTSDQLNKFFAIVLDVTSWTKQRRKRKGKSLWSWPHLLMWLVRRNGFIARRGETTALLFFVVVHLSDLRLRVRSHHSQSSFFSRRQELPRERNFKRFDWPLNACVRFWRLGPSWVKLRRMQRYGVATPPLFFHYTLWRAKVQDILFFMNSRLPFDPVAADQIFGFKAGVDRSEAWYLAEIYFSFFCTKVFLRPRRYVVPSFSAVLRLEVEDNGEERTIALINSAAPSPVAVPDKESPHVPKHERKSGCRRACRHPERGCTILGHWQASKKDAACWRGITWPGPAGPCRCTIADVGEPNMSCSSSASRAYASFPTTRTETQITGVVVRLKKQHAQSNLFPIMVRRDPENLKTLSIRDHEPML